MPRRKRPGLSRRDLVRHLQLVRLEGLPSGTYQPISDREELYLRLLRAGQALDPADFVVSEPLLLLESVRWKGDARDAVEADSAGAPAFSVPPEPAMPPG